MNTEQVQLRKPQRKPSQQGGEHGSAGARKVLRWLADGRDLASIARRLDRDEGKLKKRLAALLARLGVDTPEAALAKLKAQHDAAPEDTAPLDDEFADIEADDESAASEEWADESTK